MMRFAVRAMLLTFGMITLLLSSTLIVSGAFRPVRFVTVHLPTREAFELNIHAISPDGSIVPFAISSTGISWDQSHNNQIIWGTYEVAVRLHIWENGQRTTLEDASTNIVWSPSGMAAWWYSNPENNLQIWDGEKLHKFTTSAEEPIAIAWTEDDQLWWVQKSWNGNWELMFWDGQGAATLYSSAEPITNVRFFECGAAWLDRLEGAYIYQLREQRLLPVPPSLNTIYSEVVTDTCRTFLVHSTSVDPSKQPVAQIWDGTTQTILASNTYVLRGDHQLLGAEKAETPADQWTLSYSEEGERQQQLIQSVWPVLMGWTEATSFWAMPQTDNTTTLFVWQMEKNQTETYPFAPLSSASFRLDPVWHRAVWTESIDSTMIHLRLWDNSTMSYRSLTLSEGNGAVRLGESRWMSDGALLFTLYPDIPNQPDLPGSLYLYHWDEDRLERIGTIPANTYGFSDWITWE